MLFLSDSIFDSRERVLEDAERGKISEEESYRRLLDLDPFDYMATWGMARLRQNAGDLAGAEAYFWRTLQAQPCVWPPYLDLSGLIESQTGRLDLALGLGELAFSKILLDPEELDREDEAQLSLDPDVLPGKTKAERIGFVVDEMRSHRELESLDATALLRPYRLIHRIQEGNTTPDFVDAMLREGDSMVALLVGVLRGWARACLTDQDEGSVESALAILGEMGGAAAIPHLLEFTGLDNASLSAAAGWAFERIVDLHQDEAARVLAELASRADGRVRIAIAEKVMRRPGLDPAGTILVGLTENLDRLPKSDRSAMFPVLLTVMVATHGGAGLERARAALRRNSSLLSRATRSECESLIQLFSERPIPPPPVMEPSPWTVYDICEGEVSWEDEEEDEADAAEIEEDDEDDVFEPLLPVRKHATPGRNDPCWCGSGKKYKKCHLDRDQSGEPAEASAPADQFDDLRRRLGRFFTEAVPLSESRKAQQEFFQDTKIEPADELIFVDWMIHDWTGPHMRRGLIQEFLRRHGPGLSPREREILESWSSSFMGLHEVLEVRVGTGLQLRNVISGDAFFVHDVRLSRQMVRWDGLQARVVEGARGRELSGVGIAIPPQRIEPLREWLEEDQLRTGLPWHEYWKRHWPRIRRQPDEIRAESLSALRLNNADGDEILFSKAVLRILDRTAAIAGLKSMPQIVEEEDGKSYVWLTGSRDRENTVLGHIRIEGDRLTLDCNSKPRLERGKELLASLAGGALKHLRDEFTPQAELKRRASQSGPERIASDDERQVVAEYLERHYAKWPDLTLPALHGKTPREAVKTHRGKLQVAALLRDLENREEHKRRDGEPAYDVARLRGELGLEE